MKSRLISYAVIVIVSLMAHESFSQQQDLWVGSAINNEHALTVYVGMSVHEAEKMVARSTSGDEHPNSNALYSSGPWFSKFSIRLDKDKRYVSIMFSDFNSSLEGKKSKSNKGSFTSTYKDPEGRLYGVKSGEFEL